MIHLRLKDRNKFMQHLLIKDTFNHFLVCEGEISTATTFFINGRVNKTFFSSEELTSYNDDFVLWENVKNVCFEIIKGKKVPTKIKLVFSLSKSKYPDVISKSQTHWVPSDIGGLYIHILYENGDINIITGTSLNTFSMDKSLDQYWDSMVISFFSQYFDFDIL
jgi:hypothetical protein